MPDYDLTRRSRPIIIRDYDPRWPIEYELLARRIRQVVGTAAARIDHIGSTAVPGLAAKDVLDLQVTVLDIEKADDVTVPLRRAGFRRGEGFIFDEFRSMAADDPQLRKVYMRETDGERRAHIHIREQGRFNQRYALLFRDYLRAWPTVRTEYELLKRRAAQIFPDSIDGYLFVKDPVFHIIYEAACQWAASVDWQPDVSYV